MRQMSSKAEYGDVCTAWKVNKTELRGEWWRTGNKKWPSQEAVKEDLHFARTALCNDFLFFFVCVEEELI